LQKWGERGRSVCGTCKEGEGGAFGKKEGEEGKDEYVFGVMRKEKEKRG